ncbi:MAG: hypothetical protein EBQ92_13630, partial [Proteobacteria bacterium]|nr:hypothetical protein [Pseudomonadota bacterium]
GGMALASKVEISPNPRASLCAAATASVAVPVKLLVGVDESPQPTIRADTLKKLMNWKVRINNLRETKVSTGFFFGTEQQIEQWSFLHK